MKRLLMIAVLVVGFSPALPVRADDMNPTDTRAEFAARKANKGKYTPKVNKMKMKKHAKKHMKAKKAAK